MRLSNDGYIDLRDPRRVVTPGVVGEEVGPAPEAEAVAFLLTHAFPGHRKVVRPLSESHRRRIRLAMWADSVAERMAIVDRVWRQITTEVLPPADHATPELVQILRYGEREYPLYLDGGVTRVIPEGGLPARHPGRHEQLDLKTA
jgi:hypothetical protein